MKRKACDICGHKDCEGWGPGQPQHEYQKDNWFLGCHCPGCKKARDEAGGFVALIQSQRFSTTVENGLIKCDDRPSTFEEADRIAGQRLYRRKGYAIIGRRWFC